MTSYISESVTGDRRRVLLRGLTESLAEILPLLYTVSLVSLSKKQLFCLVRQIVMTKDTIN